MCVSDNPSKTKNQILKPQNVSEGGYYAALLCTALPYITLIVLCGSALLRCAALYVASAGHVAGVLRRLYLVGAGRIWLVQAKFNCFDIPIDTSSPCRNARVCTPGGVRIMASPSPEALVSLK